MADARTEESTRNRSKRHWLRQRAMEGATFGGMLRSRAEADGPTTLTVGTWKVSGQLLQAGAEIVTLETDQGMLWVSVSGVEVAEVRGRPGAAADSRPLAEGTSWMSLLTGLQEERQPVELLAGQEWISGRIAGVGVDVVSIESAGGMSYVRFAGIAALRLSQPWGSG